MAEYHPISAKHLSRLHQFGPRVLPGIFLGYVLSAGGISKGDIMIADIEELEEMDASELHVRRLNAKEVSTSQRSGSFIFSVAVGTVRIFGVKQCLRTSTLTQDRPERGDEQEILRGKSDELHSPTPLQEDSTRDVEKANNDFWSITVVFIYRHHVEHMPRKESFHVLLLKITGTSMENRINICMDKLHKIYFIERKAT